MILGERRESEDGMERPLVRRLSAAGRIDARRVVLIRPRGSQPGVIACVHALNPVFKLGAGQQWREFGIGQGDSAPAAGSLIGAVKRQTVST